MTKSVFTIHLSKSAGKELKPYIEQVINDSDRTMSVHAKVGDSIYAGSAASNVFGYVFEFIQNKDVCYTVAAIVIAWIRSKNGKKISITKDGYSIKAENLNEKQLFKILSDHDAQITIAEDTDNKDPS